MTNVSLSNMIYNMWSFLPGSSGVNSYMGYDQGTINQSDSTSSKRTSSHSDDMLVTGETSLETRPSKAITQPTDKSMSSLVSNVGSLLAQGIALCGFSTSWKTKLATAALTTAATGATSLIGIKPNEENQKMYDFFKTWTGDMSSFVTMVEGVAAAAGAVSLATGATVTAPISIPAIIAAVAAYGAADALYLQAKDHGLTDKAANAVFDNVGAYACDIFKVLQENQGTITKALSYIPSAMKYATSGYNVFRNFSVNSQNTAKLTQMIADASFGNAADLAMPSFETFLD